jgi:anti-anti-sigma regulatory factor
MRDRLAEVGFSEVRADAIVASVSGDIDGSTAAELRRAVAERVPSTPRSLIMDLTVST